jgi:hypothetical protein
VRVQGSSDWLSSPRTSALAWWIPKAIIVAALFVPTPARAGIWIIALIWMGSTAVRTFPRRTGIADTYWASGTGHCRPGWPLSECVQQEVGKETTMITALKKLYENHTEGRTAVKKLYECHAEDCVRAAELTVDPGRREDAGSPGQPT